MEKQKTVDVVFRVTNPVGRINKFFQFKESAISFIVEDFSTAQLFRTEGEGERLAEYLRIHGETPNQYPIKDIIEEIQINHEYDL